MKIVYYEKVIMKKDNGGTDDKITLSDDTRDFIFEMTVMTSVGNGFP